MPASAAPCPGPHGPKGARGAGGTELGTLSDAGYGRAFFDGMEEDVVPGLEAIGLIEARPAYADLLASLPA